MAGKKIIAALDIKNGRVVKSVNFVSWKDIGNPAELAKHYAEQGADEIVFLDILATHEGREALYPLIKEAAQGLAVPLAIAGGIRSVEDIDKALECGAGKVLIGSAAVSDPAFLQEACRIFGKERITVSIDAQRVDGEFHVFIKGGREDTGINAAAFAQSCEEAGVGEIVLNSMDGDGLMEGYDIKMLQAVMEKVSIPVIASGGCGSVSDIIKVFKETGCAGALIASLLHFKKAAVGTIKEEMKRHGI